MAEKKDKKSKEITNPYLTGLADRIAEWLVLLENGLDLLKQPYDPSDEKHRKEIYRVLESTQDQSFKIGTLLAKELAKLKADKLSELNPIVGVMAANITCMCKKIMSMFPEEANSIAGWKKVTKELKTASASSDQMTKIMATTGVPDVVIIPTTPLFERNGTPTREAAEGAEAGKKAWPGNGSEPQENTPEPSGPPAQVPEDEAGEIPQI